MNLNDRYFIYHTNDLFDVAEEVLNGSRHRPMPPPVENLKREEEPDPVAELQKKYDSLKEYTTKLERSHFQIREDLRKSHEVIAAFELKLQDKPQWQSQVKTALIQINKLLQMLIEKL